MLEHNCSLWNIRDDLLECNCSNMEMEQLVAVRMAFLH